MKRTVQKLIRHLTPRTRKSWNDVPTWVLMMFGFVAAMEASYYGYVLQKFAPGFLDLANAQPLASWASVSFVACVAILSIIGLQSLIWGVAAAGSLAIVQKRVFGV